MKEVLFGEHGFDIWFGTMIWCLIGIICHKLFKLFKRDSTTKLSFKYWINNNWIDTLLGLIIAAFLIRGGDEAIHYITGIGVTLPFNIKDGADLTVLYTAITAFIQWRLHKYKDKLNEQKERIAQRLK